MTDQKHFGQNNSYSTTEKDELVCFECQAKRSISEMEKTEDGFGYICRECRETGGPQ